MAGYRDLIARFGEARVGDALLAKWLSDEDALEKWSHLALDLSRIQIRKRTRTYDLTPAANGGIPASPDRPHKYWVSLWYLSMGWQEKQVAQQLQVSQNTVKQHLLYARRKLDLSGASLPKVVAVAIRTGRIP